MDAGVFIASSNMHQFCLPVGFKHTLLSLSFLLALVRFGELTVTGGVAKRSAEHK